MPSFWVACQSRLVERPRRLIPASDPGDDVVRLGGPDEGPRVGVRRGEVTVDRGLRLDGRVEAAAPVKPALGRGREGALDGASGHDQEVVGVGWKVQRG